MDKVPSRRIKIYTPTPVERLQMEGLLPLGIQVAHEIFLPLANIFPICCRCFSNIYSDLMRPFFLYRMLRTLRRLLKVDAADYMLSICGNDALRELSSPGKSGSFFYLTNDDRYMIKTIKKAEVKVSFYLLFFSPLNYFCESRT